MGIKSKIFKCIIAVAVIITFIPCSAFAGSTSKTVVGSPKQFKAKIKSPKVVKLSWKKASNAKYYAIYKGSKRIKTTKKLSYTVSGLKPKTKYQFRIRAFKKINGKNRYSSAKKIYVKMPKAKRSKAAAVLRIAKSKLGCRYSYGAAGPKRFDCSGYVYYCYKKSKAKKFSRTSAQGIYKKLRKYCVGRSVKKAKAGDIILCGRSRSSIGHAAIYYGKGKIIHAANPRKGVCISKAKYFHVVAVIRVPGM